ncbi:MAG TPA: hypothetical protein DEA08_00065 [Planctomycetes bacterium]|nr:hypothetical protein [Planctomycetota bacterium]
MPELAPALAAEQARWADWLRGQRPAAEWLASWERGRTELGEQCSPQGPPAELALEAQAGEPGWERLPLGDEDLLLIGRDPKCHVRLRNKTVSRHHATLLRLERVWVLRDEGRSTPALHKGQAVKLARLGPGDVIQLGDVELRLAAGAPPPDLWVGPRVADALLALGHPALCALALAELDAAESESAPQVAARLYPDDAQRAAAAAAKLEQARARRLPRVHALLDRHLATAATASVAELRAACEQRAAALGPQVQLVSG